VTETFKSILVLAKRLQSLNQEAVLAYTPIVDDILRSSSRDTIHIEHTLDGLLDFCGYEPILQLYKKLCRHYFFINPAATAEYINAYREMWDSEQKNEHAKPVKKRVNTLECCGSTPLFGRPPRRSVRREPARNATHSVAGRPSLAKESGPNAPQSKALSNGGRR